ncbi:MAG: Zn-dependent hydrolase [Alphaproteobacteria bacterium]|nr:Zn-dependent hydrolase [Alphaproteobacteria bacterium]
MPPVNPERLLADVRECSEIGRFKTGVHRPTYSPEDQRARAWLVARMEAAGLQAEIDGIGNVIGRGSGSGKRMLIGSHIESQPEAGRLDGAMGVLYGIEVARAGLPVDVAAWADEEGYFGHFLGSRSFIAEVTEQEIDKSVHRDNGTPLRAALIKAGYAGRPRATVEPGRYVGYAEAHVEQGDYLDMAGMRIGVVTGIIGSWLYRIVAEGVQNHAGTTRMAIRKDAGLALAKLCVAIDQRFPQVIGERSVWTTGRMIFEPGAPAVIPGRGEMTFGFRDVELTTLERLDATLRQLIDDYNRQGPCRLTVERTAQSFPALMNKFFQDALEKAAATHAPGSHMRMPSAAGHDAQILARKMPSAMLFVPSIKGISHHWAEDTADQDIALGVQVFADGIERILAG